MREQGIGGELPQPEATRTLLQAYEAVEVPHVFALGSPEDPRLHNRIDRFFEEVLSALQLNYLMKESFTTIEKKRVAAGDDETSYEEQQALILKELQVLATVTTTVLRGGVQAVIAQKEPLQPATLEAVKGYHEGDTLVTDVLFRR